MNKPISQIVLASNNQGKLKEMYALLKTINIELIPQSEFGIHDIKETGTTFIENSLIKAKYTSKATGLPSLADDSGLVIHALNGEPGVYSARYAQNDNYHSDKDTNNCYKALDKLKKTKFRHASFISVLTLCISDHHPLPFIAQGSWDGEITHQLTDGDHFGYDPIFYLPKLQKTAAQLSLAEKNSISHRAIAMKSLLCQLNEYQRGLSSI